MAKHKLARVKVVEGVPFGGPVNKALSHLDGSLVYDDVTQLVTVEPTIKQGISKALLIPMGNIAFMEVLDEAAFKAKLEAAKVKPPEPEPVRIPDDTIVLKSTKGK